MAHRSGIGMSRKDADNFWRELVMMLIGVPILIILGVMIIDALLQGATGSGLGFFKYIFYAIGGLGWIVVLYKKYMAKILKSI